MKVSEIMIRDVYKANQDDTLKTVLRQFTVQRISGMPITDERGRIRGYISDGDIMRHLGKNVKPGHHSFVSVLGYYYGVSVETESAQSGATRNDSEFHQQIAHACNKKALEVGQRSVITVNEDCELIDVLQLLAKEEVKKIPVVRNDELIGIVSRGDVVRAIALKILAM